MHLNFFKVLSMRFSMKTTISRCFLRVASLVCCCFILLGNLPIEIDATSTYYDNNNLTVKGKLRYVSSTNGTPVDNLDDGSIHTLYFNKESERSLVIEPYLSNLSSDTAKGWISDGYEISLPYSQMLAVTQLHNYGNGTRNGTAYYEVEVNEINTLLLYKSHFSSDYSVIFISGVCILILSCIFKRLTS